MGPAAPPDTAVLVELGADLLQGPVQNIGLHDLTCQEGAGNVSQLAKSLKLAVLGYDSDMFCLPDRGPDARRRNVIVDGTQRDGKEITVFCHYRRENITLHHGLRLPEMFESGRDFVGTQ